MLELTILSPSVHLVDRLEPEPDAVVVTRGHVRPWLDGGTAYLLCVRKEDGRLEPFDANVAHDCGGHD
ncbi:hypothetical protein [Motilibacter deserti]|uniref:Uncharacterized protein n=1 Tax=Motilibacter deserti TaxID=2714956 RepID=A0ABX0GTX2_9ACTN|nr:hypothetical protein [Motilibacter deserti]NHC13958.1 hypothetical protein [Motilibacter deserti]